MSSQLKIDLIAARAMIDTPAKWIKGSNARDKEGFTVSPRSSEATCHCLNGAIIAVTTGGDDLCSRYENAYDTLQKGTERGLIGLNDDLHTTHSDIMVLFAKAIASCPA